MHKCDIPVRHGFLLGENISREEKRMKWQEEDKQIMDILIEDYGVDGVMEELAERCDMALVRADNEVYRIYSAALWTVEPES